MKNSLQDQLLKSGLIDEKSVKAHNKDKRKKAKQQKHIKTPVIDEAKVAREQAERDKVAKDKALNIARENERLAKERQAQIKQIIEHAKISRDPADVAYNFTHGSQVRKLYINADIQKNLASGRLSIVASQEHYEILRSDVAEKIRSRDESYFIYQVDAADKTELDEDDPYAAFVVPDDLMW